MLDSYLCKEHGFIKLGLCVVDVKKIGDYVDFLNCFQFSNLSKSLADWLNGYVFQYSHIANSDF